MALAENRDIDGTPAETLLLAPTRIYVRSVLQLMEKLTVKGLAHITGGGLTDNIPRVLRGEIHARIDTASWRQPSVFDWLQATGNIQTDEMRRTFNCGVGMVVIVDPSATDQALQILADSGEAAWRVGEIAPGRGPVEYV